MIQDLRELWEIQRLDTQITRIEKQVVAIADGLAHTRAECDAARVRIAASAEQLEQLELEERRLEGEQKSQEALVERLEAQVYEIKTEDAYKALRHEIDHAREALSTRETRILELLEELDATRAAADAERSQLGALAARLASEENAREEQEQKLEAERQSALAERAKHASLISKPELVRYEGLSRRKSPALAVIASGHACPECRMVVPPQILIEIRAATTVATCASCERILVGPWALDAG